MEKHNLMKIVHYIFHPFKTDHAPVLHWRAIHPRQVSKSGCIIHGMRPHGNPEQLEARRCQAMALLRKGLSYRDVAGKLKTSLK